VPAQDQHYTERNIALNGEGANVSLNKLVEAFSASEREDDAAALDNRSKLAQQITEAGLASEEDGVSLLEGVTKRKAWTGTHYLGVSVR
jgi:hypothetical protein